MNGLKNEITALVMKISAVTDLFYQQKPAEAYQGMELLITSFGTVFDMLSQYKSKHPEAKIDLHGITVILTEAMNALQQKDTVLLADVLECELKVKLEEISSMVV